MTVRRLYFACLLALAAATYAAAGLISPATAGCQARFGLADGRLCLPEDAATSLLVDILARAGEVYDGLFREADVAELTGRWPWAEVVLPQARTVAVEGRRGALTVSRILVVFKNDRPLYVFWGNPDYRMDEVLAAPRLGQAPLTALRALARGAPREPG